jgi:hypothetical protein
LGLDWLLNVWWKLVTFPWHAKVISFLRDLRDDVEAFLGQIVAFPTRAITLQAFGEHLVAYIQNCSMDSRSRSPEKSRAKLGPYSSLESKDPEGKGSPTYILVTELVSKLGS